MNTILRIAIAAAVLAAAGTGCSKSGQGKYTPEQMKTIPYPNKYDLPQPTGGITLNIESETLSTKELMQVLEPQLKPLAQQGNFAVFKQRAKPAFAEAMRGKITDILLYKEAKKKATESIDDALDKVVQTELDRFLASYGNNRALADSTLRSMGFDWKSFRDYQRRQILIQSYMSQEFTKDRPISHGEIVDYYNQNKKELFCWDGTVQFRVIDIFADQLSDEFIHDGETKETAAVRLTIEIIDKLHAGGDFGKLAEQYSQDPMANQGGSWRPITIGAGSLQPPYDAIETQVTDMEPNEIAGPIASQGHLLILKLEKRQDAGCKEFKDVQNAIEQVMQMKFRKLQFDKLADKLAAQSNIMNTEPFLDQCVADAYAIWSETKP